MVAFLWRSLSNSLNQGALRPSMTNPHDLNLCECVPLVFWGRAKKVTIVPTPLQRIRAFRLHAVV